MEEDISRRTITILVVLTLVISMLGALSVMTAVNEMKYRGMQSPTTSPAQGEVSLTIVDGPKESEPVGATGQVALEIVEPEEEKPRILLLPE